MTSICCVRGRMSVERNQRAGCFMWWCSGFLHVLPKSKSMVGFLDINSSALRVLLCSPVNVYSQLPAAALSMNRTINCISEEIIITSPLLLNIWQSSNSFQIIRGKYVTCFFLYYLCRFPGCFCVRFFLSLSCYSTLNAMYMWSGTYQVWRAHNHFPLLRPCNDSLTAPLFCYLSAYLCVFVFAYNTDVLT